MAEKDEAIEMFSGITNAERHVAEYYLSAYEWDLNRAIEFYLENPPDAGAAVPPAQRVASNANQTDDAGLDPGLAVHGTTVPAPREFPSFRPPAPPVSTSALPVEHDMLDDGEDEDLQRALQASLRETSPEREMIDVEDEEEELHELARQRQAALEARRRREQQNEEMLSATTVPATNFPSFRPTAPPPPVRGNSRRRSSGSAPAASSAPYLDHPHSYPTYMDPPPTYPTFPGSGRHTSEDEPLPDSPTAAPPIPDLPDGINVEEARMLEAAMLGIPYTGRIPSFTDRPQLPQSPTAVAARYLRAEQDEAYEESLRADRAKAAAEAAQKRAQEEAEEAARREAEAAERQAREEEEAAARAAAEAESRLKRSLTLKAQRIPKEPEAEDPEAVMLMVRLPDGGRMSRRFRRGDPLQAVFDYIDVQAKGEGRLKPTGYNLVTQFPRRVFSDGAAGSLQDAGLSTRQEALFLELTSS